MAAGDHLRVWCDIYWHHGIDTGQGTVLQYSGKNESWMDLGAGRVEEVSVEDFALGREIMVVPHPYRRFDAEQTLARARERLGETRYGFDHNNCEHFVWWAIEGLHESVQIDLIHAGISLGVSALTGGLGLGLVRVAGGPHKGLVGRRLLKGLLAIGPGRVLGGLATLAVASGVWAAGLAGFTLLRDDPAFDGVERTARRAGRVAAVAGAASGAAASVSAVGAAGTVPGLSTAGILTGLTAIGRTLTFGLGSLSTGLALVLALPALLATAFGWGGAALVRRAAGRFHVDGPQFLLPRRFPDGLPFPLPWRAFRLTAWRWAVRLVRLLRDPVRAREALVDLFWATVEEVQIRCLGGHPGRPTPVSPPPDGSGPPSDPAT